MRAKKRASNDSTKTDEEIFNRFILFSIFYSQICEPSIRATIYEHEAKGDSALAISWSCAGYIVLHNIYILCYIVLRIWP